MTSLVQNHVNLHEVFLSFFSKPSKRELGVEIGAHFVIYIYIQQIVTAILVAQVSKGSLLIKML